MIWLKRLWGLLPDRCVARGCAREGARGSEQVVVIDGRRVLFCSDCHERMRLSSLRAADESISASLRVRV